MKNPWAKIYAVLGVLMLLGYLAIEARGVVLGSTDSRADAFSPEGGGGVGGSRSHGWGISGGHFGGK